MLFISAQPDQIYFIWQLEIQLRNLASLDVSKDHIQVLVAYDPEKGLKKCFEQFISENEEYAQFYAYPDRRADPKYTSSIRPHILRQHFARFPELTNETLFYHDSDILFSRIPAIEHVEQSHYCYVSDTRNYLDIAYIRRTGSEELLDNMLNIVGLSKEKLIQENAHTGGAQYILKGITDEFWKKVERDAENLYVLMMGFNKELQTKDMFTLVDKEARREGIQAWCADMWAVLWNLWVLDKQVRIHQEMNFSWPYSPISEWEEKAIQHYSGKIEDANRYFKKTEYLNYVPWYDTALDNIQEGNCSYKIVELIRNRKKELYDLRPRFPSLCIVLTAQKIASPDSVESLTHEMTTQARHIRKYVDVPMYRSDRSCNTICSLDDNRIYEQTSFSAMASSAYLAIVIIPQGLVLPEPDLISLLTDLSLAKDASSTRYPIQDLLKVDALFEATFSKVLDTELLLLNTGKMNRYVRDTSVVLLSSEDLHGIGKVPLVDRIKEIQRGKTKKTELFTQAFALNA